MCISSLSSSAGLVKWSPLKTFWLWGNLLIAFVFVRSSASLELLLLGGLLVYLTMCLGHSVGLHRHTIHQTYKTNASMKFLLLFFSCLSGLGGPRTWIVVHAYRDYWQNKENCPKYFAYDQSLVTDFFWNLHLAFHSYDLKPLKTLPQGVLEDKVVLFFEKIWLPLNLVFAFCIYSFLGFEAFVVLFCMRVSINILGHWFVGYAVHKWGEERYKIKGAKESGKNIWFLGLISFGEGFHNNHHKYPDSARMGLKFLEVDLGYLSLLCLEKLRLVKDIKVAKEKV